MRLRVLKIGGSWLGRTSMLTDLQRWFDQADQASITVMLVGGGKLIEAIRIWDRLRPADSAMVHWRCVDLLSVSFAHVQDSMQQDQAFQDVDYLATTADTQQFQDLLRTDESPRPSKQRYLLNVPAAYHQGVASVLPADWSTTTDSIAWHLADHWQADECVLLKSCQIDPTQTLDDWIRQGIIDDACGQLRDSSVPLRVLNA
ncbi:MAG: protein kinase [Planctomycetota bacterium]